MFSSASRVFKFGLEGILRNVWLSAITVTTITLTLLSLSAVVALQVGISQIVSAAEARIDLSVYFFPTATDDQVQSVKVALEALQGVTSVTLVTKEEALAQYQEDAKNAPELLRPLEALGDNPFGESLVIKADSPDHYERTIEELAKPQYKDLIEGEQKDYEANQVFIQNFTNFTDKIRLGAIAVSGLFAFIACLLLFNTIRVAIYTHRDEIAVMKLVGATNRFVRSPFLIEVFFYCLVATIIAAGIALGLLSFGQPYLNRYFGVDAVNIYQFFSQNWYLIFSGEFLFIFILSAVSSVFAIRKYLRV